MILYRGGHNTYGQALGILMLETSFPRIPGSIGHHATFPFPVIHQVVQGASPTRVVQEADPALLQPFISAARELENKGVRAITTSCGFLAIFHRQMAQALRVPLISSALIQVPIVSRMVGGKPVGILTSRRPTLTEKHFRGVGWSSKEISVVVKGLEGAPVFDLSRHGNPDRALDFLQIGREVVQAARELVEESPEVAAIVLECTNFPPYADSIQQAVDRPVFSIVTLVKMVYSSLERREFAGVDVMSGPPVSGFATANRSSPGKE